MQSLPAARLSDGQARQVESEVSKIPAQIEMVVFGIAKIMK